MSEAAFGQVTFEESFTGTTADGWYFGGLGSSTHPYLTAGVHDSVGNGWLRLTQNTGNQATYAILDTEIFSVNAQIQIEMEYSFWNDGRPTSTAGADGIAFFLVDGSVEASSFVPGAYGGSMGYAQKDQAATGVTGGIPGMAGGYLGIAFDNWGNYSNPTEGRVGGTGFIPNSIAVRGPESSNWGFIAGSADLSTLPGGGQMDFPNSTTRPTGSADYRSFRLTLDANNYLVVEMKFGLSSDYITAFTADLSGYDRPDSFKIGFTGATGGEMEIHEIRNIKVETTPFTPNFYEWDNRVDGSGTATGDSSGALGSNWVGDAPPGIHGDILFRNASLPVDQTVTVGGDYTARSLNFESSRNHTLGGAGVITLGDGLAGNAPSINVVQSGSEIVHHRIGNNLALAEATFITNAGNAVLCLNGTYDTNGKTTTLSGDGSINFNGAILDNGAIVKSGTGITTINHANTSWGGALTIYEGVVAVTTNNALGTTAAGTTVAGGSLFLRGGVNYSTTESLSLAGDGVTIRGGDRSGALHGDGGHNTFAGAVTLIGNASLGARADSSLTVSGAITGADRTLTKVGDGLVSLTGTNTYGSGGYGNTVVSDGVLRVTTASLPGGYSTETSGTGTNNYGAVVLNGGVLELASGTNFTRTVTTDLSAAANREEGIYWTGDGGFSAYDATTPGLTRTVTLSGGGGLTWGSGNFVGNNHALLFSSAFANGTVDFTNNIALAGTGSTRREIRVANGSAAVDAILSGSLSGSAGINKTGPGTLSLTGTNTYGAGGYGDTVISGGALRVTTGSLPGGYDTNDTGSNYGAVVLNGGVLELASSTTFTRSIATSTTSWNREERIYWTGDGGFSAFGGTRTVTLGGGDLTWGSTGFVGANNKLLFGSDGANSTVDFTNNLALGGSGTRTIQVTAGTVGTVASGQLSGVVSGSAGLTVTGNGRLDLTGNNTHTGSVTVVGAELRLTGTNGDLAQSSGYSVRQGGTLTLSNTGGSNSDRLRNNRTLSLDGGTFVFTGRNSNNTDVTESIGTLELAGGANTVDVINYRTNGYTHLNVSSLDRDAGATVNFTHTGSVGDTNTYAASGDDSRIRFGTSPDLDNGILAYATVNGSDWATVNGDRYLLAASGYKTTAQDTWTDAADNVSISSAQTLGGARSINSLKLVGAANITQAGHTLTLDSGGLLTTGSSAVTISGGTLTTGNSNELIVHAYNTGGTTISSVIAGAGGLTKSGTGTLTLSGSSPNTFTGATTVNDGTLVLNKTAGVNAIAGDNNAATDDLVIGDGRGQDRVVLGASEQIGDAANVVLRGGEVGNSANVASLVFDDSAGPITETFASLHIEGNSVLDFAGGTPCSPSFLILGSLTGSEGSLLTIKNWIEFTDYLLVEKSAFDAIPEADRPRIVFEGYSGTWSFQSYNGSYYQITPVPEPAAYGVLALGGLVAFSLTRRRRRAAA